MVLKVFVRADCPNLPAANEVASEFPFSIIYDLDEPEGLAEAAFHDVLCAPTFVLVNDDDTVIHSWKNHVPRPIDIANLTA